ncbi:hypothetical protein CDD81_5612 [Ophiocordyceps australis]|uniref:Argonaute complex, subunit Arb1 n=1 Tax=Ophiocordyceps australis TaxID=1399860 RepID=A0A2C5Y9S4_9HYPO|nr:hypothetical protein CDD81_5612 [Ophiocordyceps australis]
MAVSDDPPPEQATIPVTSVKKKKKKSGKSTASRGPTALPKNRGTGFEEYFADPPLTPHEAAEEKESIYTPTVSFEERIQSCIQRFRARRRLHQSHVIYFNEYLFLGGIDCTNNPFAGVDPKELKELTPAERRDATATDAVHRSAEADERFYAGDLTHWSVDFTGVAAGFFSASLPSMTDSQEEEMALGIQVVQNFLRYVYHHDVCPEYKDDVCEALRLCDLVKDEWPVYEKLRHMLPGYFHTAATQLFAPPDPSDWSFSRLPHPKGFDAKAVFYTACALLGEADALQSSTQGGPKVVSQSDCTLEVVRVELPSADLVQRFKTLQINNQVFRQTPMGKAFFKPATIEEGSVDPVVTEPATESETWLYFDQDVLAVMKPGTKMALRIVELDTGIRFVSNIPDVFPSYYVFLPQILMKYYKAARPNDRPAPSVHDPDVEEKQHAKEAREG